MVLDKVIFTYLLSILLNYILINKYHFFFTKRIFDKNFLKPQSFHKIPTIRIGGIIIYILILSNLFFFYDKNNFIYSIFFLGSLFYFLGFVGDIQIHIKPEVRLIAMLILSFFIIYFLNIKIFNTQIQFLNKIITINLFFSTAFVCLCMLFVINGFNLIDGFNGLLTIHTLIILAVLFYVCTQYQNTENIKNLIMILGAVCLSFLFFNFPKANIFLGDGGAYFLGSTVSLIIIEINNLNLGIPPFFFAALLFYVFFEVFFSFSRKIFFYKKSPLHPDQEHLHMIFFKFICKFNKNNKIKANYLTGLLINLIYLILIIPLLFFYINNYQTLCKIYFFILIILYLIFYLFLNKKLK
jgi:UDP-N-acetylmuramyl pentapeptide phosphotransferase/UDP-N-acetylglucosamine-1-phosphate transferase